MAKIQFSHVKLVREIDKTSGQRKTLNVACFKTDAIDANGKITSKADLGDACDQICNDPNFTNGSIDKAEISHM